MYNVSRVSTCKLAKNTLNSKPIKYHSCFHVCPRVHSSQCTMYNAQVTMIRLIEGSKLDPGPSWGRGNGCTARRAMREFYQSEHVTKNKAQALTVIVANPFIVLTGQGVGVPKNKKHSRVLELVSHRTEMIPARSFGPTNVSNVKSYASHATPCALRCHEVRLHTTVGGCPQHKTPNTPLHTSYLVTTYREAQIKQLHDCHKNIFPVRD